MPPNLSSVFAQVLRKSRSNGSRRNFCSSPNSITSSGNELMVAARFICRAIAATVGYSVFGPRIFGDQTAERKQQRKEYEEFFEKTEKKWSDLAASVRKS